MSALSDLKSLHRWDYSFISYIIRLPSDTGKSLYIKARQPVADRDSQCAICLDTMKTGQALLKHTICGNMGHAECINRWLRTENEDTGEATDSCAYCRGPSIDSWKTGKKSQSGLVWYPQAVRVLQARFLALFVIWAALAVASLLMFDSRSDTSRFLTIAAVYHARRSLLAYAHSQIHMPSARSGPHLTDTVGDPRYASFIQADLAVLLLGGSYYVFSQYGVWGGLICVPPLLVAAMEGVLLAKYSAFDCGAIEYLAH